MFRWFRRNCVPLELLVAILGVDCEESCLCGCNMIFWPVLEHLLVRMNSLPGVAFSVTRSGRAWIATLWSQTPCIVTYAVMTMKSELWGGIPQHSVAKRSFADRMKLLRSKCRQKQHTPVTPLVDKLSKFQNRQEEGQ